MKFKDFRLIYISQDYLNFLHEIDSEIFFVNQKNYEKKPYLGILISENDRKYVIPLTSAKPRHAKLNDVTTTSYRIYEIIDITKNHYDENDILVDADVEWLKSKAINPSDYFKYKKRLLSILDLRKMFPIKDGTYTLIELDLNVPLDLEEKQRRILMQKEYDFCVRLKDSIRKKASKIYRKQMESGKILPFHCNFKLLEQVSDTYQLKQKDIES